MKQTDFNLTVRPEQEGSRKIKKDVERERERERERKGENEKV